MPYTLHHDSPSHASLRLWPHNMLGSRGFVVVISSSALALALPMLALLGSPALWGLLPFAGLVLGGLWFALARNWRDRRIVEQMQISRETVYLRHVSAAGTVQEWRAELPWVTLTLTPQGGPVPYYLTLGGGGREVELGVFLTPEERVALHEALSSLMMRLRSPSQS